VCNRQQTTRWDEREGPVAFLEKRRACGALKVRSWSTTTREKGVLRRRSECKVCAYTQQECKISERRFQQVNQRLSEEILAEVDCSSQRESGSSQTFQEGRERRKWLLKAIDKVQEETTRR
jgi:hypothetical protein